MINLKIFKSVLLTVRKIYQVLVHCQKIKINTQKNYIKCIYMEVKTIDINVKEWFDRVNGNSYFAGTVTVNYAMKSEKSFKMPFQYGYGEHYIQQAGKLLVDQIGLNKDSCTALSSYCRVYNIILRTSKQENCLKRELMNI